MHDKRTTLGWADHKAYVSGAKGLKSSFPLLQLQTGERNKQDEQLSEETKTMQIKTTL